eukprot:g8961.t2
MDTKLWFVFGVCSGSHWQLKASPESVPDVPKNDIKVLEKLKAWEKIQREDLSNLCARFFADGAHVEALILGNLTAEDAKQLSAKLVTGLQLSKPLQSLPYRAEASLPEGSTLWELDSMDVDDPNHAVLLKLQLPIGLEDEMLAMLLDKVLSAKFFEILRTQQQLGYIVQMAASVPLKSPMIVALVQTEFLPDYVRGCIGKFMEEHFHFVEESLGAEEFEVCKSGLISQLRMKPKNLREEAARFTSQLHDRTFDFGRRERDLVINASGIHIRNSNLTSSLSRLELLSSASSAYANSTFSSATSRDSNNTMGIVIADSCLKGHWMNMTCNKSGVNLEGSAALSTDARQLLQIRASTVEAGSKSTLTAGIISISTESSLQLEARILVGFATKQTPSEPPELQLTTQGSMTLGSSQYQWILSGLTASAQNLEITASSSVSIQHDTTCHNNGTKVADRCQGVLGSWATTTGAWPPSADGDVSFNLVLLARESLTIAQAARLQAASAFLCSNQMNVDDQSVIDVSGGGCSASSRYSQQPAGGISVPGPAKGGPWLAGRGGFAWWFDGQSLSLMTCDPRDPQYGRKGAKHQSSALAELSNVLPNAGLLVASKPVSFQQAEEDSTPARRWLGLCKLQDGFNR